VILKSDFKTLKRLFGLLLATESDTQSIALRRMLRKKSKQINYTPLFGDMNLLIEGICIPEGDIVGNQQAALMH
jgi:hypothetical protein